MILTLLKLNFSLNHYVYFNDINYGGQNNSIVGRLLVMHAANLDSVSGFPYGPLSIGRYGPATNKQNVFY